MAKTLKELFDLLATLDGGAEFTALVNSQLNEVRTEAAGWRTKYSNLAENLGVKGNADQDAALEGIKATLAALTAGGQKPDQVGAQLQSLAEQVKTLTEKAAAEETKAKSEHDRRISEAKFNQALAALSKHQAANPQELAKILINNISAKEDDTIIYKNGEQELDVESGAAAWLEQNPWAKLNTQNAGAGSQGGKSGTLDLENMSVEDYAKYYADRESKK